MKKRSAARSHKPDSRPLRATAQKIWVAHLAIAQHTHNSHLSLRGLARKRLWITGINPSTGRTRSRPRRVGRDAADAHCGVEQSCWPRRGPRRRLARGMEPPTPAGCRSTSVELMRRMGLLTGFKE